VFGKWAFRKVTTTHNASEALSDLWESYACGGVVVVGLVSGTKALSHSNKIEVRSSSVV